MFGRKTLRVNREAVLAARIHRRERVETELDSSGRLFLKIPRREGWWLWLLMRLFYVPEYKRVELDDLGAMVWTKCDGTATVSSLAKAVAQQKGLHGREAEVAMLSFVDLLMRRGLVDLVLPAGGAGK